MSSSDSSSVPSKPPVSKDYARDNRLSFRNFAEHQMRREFKDVALEKCTNHVREFAKCAEKEGLMVIMNCRHLNRALNACMEEHNSDDAWEMYKSEHEEELRKRTLKTKTDR